MTEISSEKCRKHRENLAWGYKKILKHVYILQQMRDNIPSVVYNMLPYILSLIVLAFTSRKSRVPKAEGILCDKGSR